MVAARGGGVVGPFVDGGSIVGGVVTVGVAGIVMGEYVFISAGTRAGRCANCPLAGRGSRVSPCGPGAGSGLSCAVGESITTSGRGGSRETARSGTDGRSVDRASSSIPMMNRASCNRGARTEIFCRVSGRSTSWFDWNCDAEEIVHRTS